MAAETITGVIQRLGFADMLIWLLTFAVVYGILNQTKILPRASQALLSIGIAFLVLLAAPAGLLTFISNLSSNLVLVVLGILLLMVLFEAFGMKKTLAIPDPDKPGSFMKKDVFWLTEHSRAFQIAMVMIAAVVFVTAGGLPLLGIQLPTNINLTGSIFIIGMILAVLYLVMQKSD
jgi:hypothetical protein